MRRCGRCEQYKPVEEFAWRRKARGSATTIAAPAEPAISRRYAANRQRYIDSAVRRKRSLVEKRVGYLVAYLREHPCVDCGEADPVVLEFDHLRDKKFGIGTRFRDREWQSILDEMAKCEVVCANCDRRRTVRRGGFARAVVAQR